MDHLQQVVAAQSRPARNTCQPNQICTKPNLQKFAGTPLRAARRSKHGSPSDFRQPDFWLLRAFKFPVWRNMDKWPTGGCLLGDNSTFFGLHMVLGVQTPMIAAVPAWRLSKLTLECAIEGSFRFVSDVGGDFRNASRCHFEYSRGQVKPPAGQVSHGRLGKIAGKALDESGPRNADLIRESPLRLQGRL